MIRKINATMKTIQQMGHSEEEYRQIFKLLTDSELALLERMDNLHRLKSVELDTLYVLVNRIMDMLISRFPKQRVSQLAMA